MQPQEVLMHSLIRYCFAVAIGLSATTALAEAQGTKASKADEMFIKEAMQGDLAEVNMGKLAQDKAQSDGVKSFGKMLEQDHGEHSQKVQSKAQELGVTPPQEPNATQKAMYDRLSKLSGAKFDEQFVKEMVSDHKKDIGKYEKEAKSKSPLADFAKETLPTLQHHLQTADALEKHK
jgi:putative membrane protein